MTHVTWRYAALGHAMTCLAAVAIIAPGAGCRAPSRSAPETVSRAEPPSSRAATSALEGSTAGQSARRAATANETGFSSKPADNTVKLAFGGDTMLARLVDATSSARGPKYVWGDVLPLLASADLCLVNLECVIAESGAPFVPKRVFYFRARPRAIDALRVAGIDYVSLANNHAMDYQAPALLETLQRLDRARIAHAGAGASLAEAERPALLEAGGVKVAVVAFADHFELYAAGRNEPGTNVIEIATEGASFERVRRALRRGRDTGADLVVFSIHWGPNMREEPPPEFVEFARATIDAGADIFHGHSAHVFQGIEIYREKPIFYDTGDLVDDYAVDDLLRNDRQLLFIVEASRSGVHAVDLVPLFISDMQVNRARGEDFDAILSRLRRLSTPMGTRVERKDGRLSLMSARAQ